MTSAYARKTARTEAKNQVGHVLYFAFRFGAKLD